MMKKWWLVPLLFAFIATPAWAQDGGALAPEEALDAAPSDEAAASDESAAEPAPEEEVAPSEAATPEAAEEGRPEGGDKVQPARLKREGQEAQDARKAAMKALREKGGEEVLSTPFGAGGAPLVVPPPRVTSEVLPRIEHHGYFRFRANAFGNLDLDTRGTSPVPPPIDSSHRGVDSQRHVEASDADTLLGANIRLRYAPSIFITEDLSVHVVMDIFDNLLLGSTPASAVGSAPFFSFGGAESPNLDRVAQESLAVRAVYGQADTLLGTLQAGRMPDHWGLGLVSNEGGAYSRTRQLLGQRAWSCIDCDDGDYIDRVQFTTREPFWNLFDISFAWDFVDEGVGGYSTQRDAIGQALDLGQADDVLQFVLAIFDRPNTKQAIDERKRAVEVLHEMAFDWGLRFVYRKQKSGLLDDETSGDGNAIQAQLFARNAAMYIFDFWGQLFVPFDHKLNLRLEAELVAMAGSVERAMTPDDAEQDLVHLGGAIESEVQIDDLYVGLNTGFAWAKDMKYSGHPLVDAFNPAGTTFRLDRNYQLDLIMFRELMGGVSNAVYFNPFVAFHFPVEGVQSSDVLGARLDMISAVAIEPSVTPGDAVWYGFEADVRLFYEEADRFRAEIAGGLFFPGGVWTRQPDRIYPILPSVDTFQDHLSVNKAYKGNTAWTIQAKVWWLF